MDCIELSIKSLEDESKKLAKQIEKKYKPDAVIFIARGGFLIGRVVSENFNIPLIAITAERSGNTIKNIVSPILPYIPRFICDFLRKAEIKSDIHKTCTDRKVALINKNIDISKFKNLLIIDDSVDTGMSMFAVVKKIKEMHPIADIKTAAINVLSNSEDVIKIDFYNFKDLIMRTPMSKDSKEYKAFEKIYSSYNN